MLIKRIQYLLLIVLDAFLAVTSVAGGIGLLTGVISPPTELLQGSIFGSYTIPGLALLFLVGGSALAAMVLMLRRHAEGALASGLAAMMIMGFEIVEVLVIGSEPGLARNLQLFYFTLGLVIAVLAAALWAIEHGVGLRHVTHSRVH
jgi:hypothetical protein